MKNTASDMAGIPYDPLDMASLQLWARENRDDNRLQIERSSDIFEKFIQNLSVCFCD